MFRVSRTPHLTDIARGVIKKKEKKHVKELTWEVVGVHERLSREGQNTSGENERSNLFRNCRPLRGQRKPTAILGIPNGLRNWTNIGE